MKVNTPKDIAERMADQIGIYGEDRCYFVADLVEEIRDAVRNEEKLQYAGIPV
jgi:hypothetical protein